MKKIFTLILCAMAHIVTCSAVNPEELTIVGETTYTIQQEVADNWASTIYDVPVAGIAGLLGVEKGYLQENFASMFYAQTWDPSLITLGDLVNDGNVDVPAGFYYEAGVAVDENGEATPVCVNTYDWSACVFFFHKGVYEPEYDIVQIGCGQNAGRPERIGRHEVNNYIVNGDKAYVIHFNVVIEASGQLNVEDMASVGGQEWVLEGRNPRRSWAELDSLELDMDGILAQFSAAMGREVYADDLRLMAINEYNGLTDAYTADNYDDLKGFWFTAETGKTQGYAWGTKSFYINYMPSEGKLYLGNMPDVFSGGEEMGTKVYLVADETHYYEIAFSMTIAQPGFTLETCELQEMNMVVQLVPSEAWEVRRIDVAYIEEMMGATGLKFYGVTAEGATTTSYSVNEAYELGGGGFWMSPLDEYGWAHAATYSGQGAFAIWYTGSSEMVFFNVPGFSQVGDKAKATFYMANLWDGKAVKINMTVRYVSEIKEYEPLGYEDLELAGRDEGGYSYSEIEHDYTLCSEAFGVDADELRDNAELAVINPDGELSTDGLDNESMFTFNADGEQVDMYSPDAAFRIGLVDGLLMAYIINDEDLANDYQATVYLIYDYEGEEENEEGEVENVARLLIYAYNVTIKGNGQGEDAITAVKAAANDATVYDLAGRELAQPRKGICIKDSRKFIVK